MTADVADSGAHLAQIVGRIEQLEAEIAELNAHKSEIYKEAKGHGFDVAALREVVGIRRKQGCDPEKFAEREAIVELYVGQLNNFAGHVVHARRVPARATVVPDRETSRPEPAFPVAAQSGGTRTTAQGTADRGAGSAAAEADVVPRYAVQSVTDAEAGESATLDDPASALDDPNCEMDRETGPGKADGRLPAGSEPIGDRREPVRGASHAGPGENPGADLLTDGCKADPSAERHDGHEGGESRMVALPDPGSVNAPAGGSEIPDAGIIHRSEAATEVRHEIARDASGAGTTREPAPPQRREPCDFPKRPLVAGGIMWTHYRESQGWSDDEIQARYQGVVPRSVAQIAASLGGGA